MSSICGCGHFDWEHRVLKGEDGGCEKCACTGFHLKAGIGGMMDKKDFYFLGRFIFVPLCFFYSGYKFPHPEKRIYIDPIKIVERESNWWCQDDDLKKSIWDGKPKVNQTNSEIRKYFEQPHVDYFSKKKILWFTKIYERNDYDYPFTEKDKMSLALYVEKRDRKTDFFQVFEVTYDKLNCPKVQDICVYDPLHSYKLPIYTGIKKSLIKAIQ